MEAYEANVFIFLLWRYIEYLLSFGMDGRTQSASQELTSGSSPGRETKRDIEHLLIGKQYIGNGNNMVRNTY